MKKEEIETLEYAADEIKNLRRSNEIMSARLSVYDEMMRLFHSSPQGRGGNAMMHPDPLFQLEQLLIKNKPKDAK